MILKLFEICQLLTRSLSTKYVHVPTSQRTNNAHAYAPELLKKNRRPGTHATVFLLTYNGTTTVTSYIGTENPTPWSHVRCRGGPNRTSLCMCPWKKTEKQGRAGVWVSVLLWLYREMRSVCGAFCNAAPVISWCHHLSSIFPDTVRSFLHLPAGRWFLLAINRAS